jgi:PAS domain S-box-containing protein
MQGWFGVLVTVLAHALPVRLRYIPQVTSRSSPSLPPLLRGAVVAISYFVIAKGSLTLASLHPSASPVWPPSGLALASLLLWGNGLWPAIAAGAFVTNATTFGTLSTSSLIAGGNTLEALITAALLKRLNAHLFEGPSEVVLFACLTLVPGTMIGATMGVGSLVLAGFADPAKFPAIWLTWWLGDVGGQLLLTPFIVLWAKSSLKEMDRAELQRLALLLGATIVIGLVAFSPLLHQTTARSPLGFFAIGPLLWAALRHNQRDTATVALMLSAFAIWGTLSDGGPFARPNLNDSFLLTIAFVIGTAVPSLVLSADVAGWRLSEERHHALVERSSEVKLAGILAIAGDAIVSIDAKHRINLFNEAAERMFGYSPSEVLGEPIDILIPTRFHTAHKQHIERFASGPDIARRMGERQEVVARRKNGEEFPTEASISKLDVGGERFYTVVLRDVTERKRAEKLQGQLVAELDHRVKNVLARVAAVAMYTGLGSSTKEELLQTLEGRIQSLADAHVLLSHSRWKGVGLADLVRHQLAPYTNASNTTIDGPEVMLTAAATEAVAMVLYELVTNAAKYGALSTPQGRVSVIWAGGSNGRLSEGIVIRWRETGGPLVAAPKRSGYGTILVRDLIPHEIGGAVDLAFATEGVSCHIRLPPEQLTSR